MKATVDTNVLVRMFTADNPDEGAKAEAFLLSCDVVVTNQAFCELTWVLRRIYKFTRQEIKSAIISLAETDTVTLDRPAVEAGLAFMEAGGDFADGVIEFEGRRFGGRTFATFDRKAASIIQAKGRDCVLLDAD